MKSMPNQKNQTKSEPIRKNQKNQKKSVSREHDAAKCNMLGGQKTVQTRMVFLMQKNTMQKHFTPVGCFCRSVLSEEHFNKKHFTPVGCFC